MMVATESSLDTVQQTQHMLDPEKSNAVPCPTISGDGQAVADPEPPYSIFTIPEKRSIVLIAALTTLFPPLTGSVYYPVINVLAKDLNVSVSDINLTITAYLIVQGIAPSFIGNLSDETGRRPALIVAFTIYIAGCIGAAVKGNYALLMVMRCLQSAGSSGTIALSLATVSDIVTSAERGIYTSYVQMGWMVGPPVGPVIGGLLSQYLGWRSIFWFLTIFAAVVFAFLLIFLPETSRKIVGNGSIPAQEWNMSLLAYLRLRKLRKANSNSSTDPLDGTILLPIPTAVKATTHLNPLTSLKLFLDKETSILILYSGLIYASSYMVLSSLPTQLQSSYGLNTLHTSLCYLATGTGTIASTLLIGRLLDWNFRRHASQLHMPITANKQQDLASFPIERARLQASLPFLLLAAVSLVSYGWTLQARTYVAAPLIFLFLQAFATSCAYQGCSNLIMDLNRDRPGAASAAVNFARCLMGAGGVAFAGPLNDRAGVGWMTLTIVGIWILFSPLAWLVLRCGPRWREEKRVRKLEACA